jgi:hypothetical protein
MAHRRRHPGCSASGTGFRAGADLTGPGSPGRTSSAHMSGRTGEDPGSGGTMAGYGHAQDQVGDAGQGRGCDSVAPRRASLSHSCPIAPGRAVPREAVGVTGTGDAGRGRAWRRRRAHPDASWGRPEPAAYLCASTWHARTSPEPGISPESGPGPGSWAPLPAPASRVTGQAPGPARARVRPTPAGPGQPDGDAATARIATAMCHRCPRPGPGSGFAPSGSFRTVDLVTKPLDAKTWPDFARLVEDHRGVWAGCWCLNATVALFDRHGFERVRRIGKHHWVVSRFVG